MSLGPLEESFRAQFGSESGSVTAINERPSLLKKISSWNPFSSRNNLIRLPTTDAPESSAQSLPEGVVFEEPSWFVLSRWDRLLIFGICLLGAVACFALCFVISPMLVFKARKFALLWTLGSVLFVVAFGALQGPRNFVLHLVTPSRLPFTLAYFGSIVATLVFSMVFKSTILTILACLTQILAAVWYTVSYFPMGTQSLKFVSRTGAGQVTNWINS